MLTKLKLRKDAIVFAAWSTVLLFILWAAGPLGQVGAVNKIANGQFAAISGWTSQDADPVPTSDYTSGADSAGFSGTISNYGTDYTAAGGSLRFAASGANGQQAKGARYYYQDFSITQPRANARLSFAWKKNWTGGSAPLAQTVSVILVKPDGKFAVVWADRQLRNDSSWRKIENLDLGGYTTGTGTYQLRLMAHLENTGSETSMLTETWFDEVYFDVREQDNSVPATVGSPSASVVSSTQINLSWTGATDTEGVVGYKIFVNGDKNPAATITHTGAGSYTNSVTGLRAATLYTFIIRAVDSNGNYSTGDTLLSAATLPSQGEPSGVAAGTGNPPAANVLKNSNFQNNSTNWTLVNDTTFRQSSGFSTAWDAVGYTGQLNNGGTAFNGSGGGFRYLASGRNRQGARYLDQAFNVSYLPDASNKFWLSLAWKKRWYNDKNTVPRDQYAAVLLIKPNATSVTLWSDSLKSNHGTTWQLVQDQDISTNFTQTGMYTLRLYGKLRNDDADNAAWSEILFDEAMVYIPDITAPAAPGGLTATVVSDKRIDLKWNYSTDNIGVTDYRIYRKKSSDISYTNIGSTTTGLTFTDTDSTGLLPSTDYNYYLTAIDARSNESSAGNIVNARTKDTDTTPPEPPANVRVVANTASETEIFWDAATDIGLGVAGYRIYRATDSGGSPRTFELITEVDADVRSYKNTALQAKRTYWYQVVTVDLENLVSLPSENVSVYVPPSPHGYYEATESRCGICHRGHSGLAARVLAKPAQPMLCLTCHDGWGSRYLIKPDLQPLAQNNVFHPMKDTEAALVGKTGSLLKCVDCHNPHGDKKTGTTDLYPRWLRSSDGTNYYYQGNQYCLACHGTVDRNWSANYWENTFGDHNNPDAVHYDISDPVIKPNQNLLIPPSGTQITCVMCHDKHASPNYRLTLAREEGLCFKCHNSSQVSASGTADILEQFNRKSSRHNIFDTDQTDNGEGPSKVECVNCHGPHTVSNQLFPNNTTSAVISDPDNTKLPWTGTVVDFCIKCHDGTPPTTANNSVTVQVPYNVLMPTAQITTNASGWDKRSFKGSSHWNKGIQTCRQCHEQHGSDYDRLTKLPEDKDSGNGICFQCHDGANSSYSTAPNVKSQFLKATRHNTLVDTSKHRDTENYNNQALVNRHAECYDCHDPHSASQADPIVQVGTTSPATPPKPSGALANIKGLGFSGARMVWTSLPYNDPLYQVKTVEYQYELCYKCHSSYSFSTTPATGMTDVAKEFNKVNVAFHPVEDVGKTLNGRFAGTDRFGQAWSPLRIMFCTDCHGSETASDPVGPHGSNYTRILKGTWLPTTGSGSTDALCFKCHLIDNYVNVGTKGTGGNANGYGGTYTGFRSGSTNLHVWHVKEKNAKCQNCHSAIPHGYSRRHLIVLRTEVEPYVDKNDAGSPIAAKLSAYTPKDSGYSKGNCSNNCGH